MRVECTGLKEAIKHLEDIRKKANGQRMHDVLQRLADEGYQVASAQFGSAIYDGNNDVQVNIVWESENTVSVVASGKTVLFIEFGSGALYGYGHPTAQQNGYGPGTWSDNEELGGKHHWDDPNGWYYEHGHKSWGNPPARAMYDASLKIHEEIEKIIRGVLA